MSIINPKLEAEKIQAIRQVPELLKQSDAFMVVAIGPQGTANMIFPGIVAQEQMIGVVEILKTIMVSNVLAQGAQAAKAAGAKVT